MPNAKILAEKQAVVASMVEKLKNASIASMMTLSEDGISIRAVDNLGEEKVNESFEW